MTRKQIENQLPKGYGIDKCEGFWYFNGPDCYEWEDSCTYYTTLDDVPLERWVEDFNSKRENFKNGGKW